MEETENRLSSFKEDVQRGGRIESQLEEYASRLNKELTLQIADVGLTMHRMEGCGEAFFDETLRTRRSLDLLDQKTIREDYNGFVLSDSAHEIDRRVEDMVDWLVSSELDEWKRLGAQMEHAESPLARTVTEQLEARFDYDRSRLQTLFGKVSQAAMELFDPASESAGVAESGRNAATNALFLALAAIVALGVSLTHPNSSVGLTPPLSIAAGLAGAAIAVTPYTRRRAKKRLHRRVQALREQLERDLRRTAEKEIEASKKKIWEIVETPLQTIREEYNELSAKREELAKLEERAAKLLERFAAENSA